LSTPPWTPHAIDSEKVREGLKNVLLGPAQLAEGAASFLM
jgi:hypothetical protein